MKPKIVIVGSANTDMVVNVRHIPQPGETVVGGDFIQSQGGKGANQAVAAARLGADVTLIARLGRDNLGEAALAAYQLDKINTACIIRDDHTPSGVALIMVNQEGENIIAVAPGANAKLSPADIIAAEDSILGAQCMLVQLEIPLETVHAALQLAAKHHVLTILNPAPVTNIPAETLELVDYLTPNKNEGAMLVGVDSSIQTNVVADLLRSKFKVKNIVMTLGKMGAQVCDARNEIVEPYPVRTVDTTGAGDAFNAGLAVALARGDSLPEAVRFANAVAALSTTHPGAQPSMPKLEDVLALIRSNS